MDRAGIATAVKHFPGLGRVRGNTDFDRRVVDDQTTRRDPRWPPSPPTIDAGVDMVMVSSAYYAKIDAGPPRRVLDRGHRRRCCGGTSGFAGVVISDDLAAAAMADLAPAQRALRFVAGRGRPADHR